MTVRDALIINHDQAQRGSAPARARRNALLRYARQHGATCRALGIVLDVSFNSIYRWSGGPIAPIPGILDGHCPDRLAPATDVIPPIPGQQAIPA